MRECVNVGVEIIEIIEIIETIIFNGGGERGGNVGMC